jgi:hypothetical protein
MTVAQVRMLAESPASILEEETASSLERILLEHGHELRPFHLDEIRRVLSIVEKLYSEIDSDNGYSEVPMRGEV